MEQNVFESNAYKRSRNSYIVFSLVEYLGTLLVADAFLAKLLTEIGISDSLTGIISTCISLGGVFQLLAIFVARSKASAKTISTLAYVVTTTMFMLEYIVPFLPFSHGVKTVLFLVFILLGYAVCSVGQNILFKWANSFVDPARRGSYSAVKEMVSLFGGMVFSYIMGRVMDHFSNGNIDIAFIVMAVTLLVLNIVGFVSIIAIRREPHFAPDENRDENKSLKLVFKNTLGNRACLNVIIMVCLWSMSRYLVVGFLGTFKIKELAISVGTVQIINIIANGLRLILSKPIGRYSDKHSFAKGMKLGLMLELISYFAVVLVRPQWWWLIAGQTIFYFVGMAGTNANQTNIIYSYIDANYFIEANAMKTALSGLVGFGIALVGGKIIDLVQANGNMVFGMHMYGQQVLAFISIVIMIVNLLFIHFVIEKQQVKIQ